MRAFVTGGTGLIGRQLVDVLLHGGWEVSVLTRDPARGKDLEARGVNLVVGDVTRPRFQAAVSRAEVVFHVAGWYETGVRDARRMLDVNVTGTGNVLSLARTENVGRVVYTSTEGVFAPASKDHPATEASPVQTVLPDPYVSSKVQAHQLAVNEMHAGLPVTIVLPAAVFGPGDTGQLGRSLALLARGGHTPRTSPRVTSSRRREARRASCTSSGIVSSRWPSSTGWRPGRPAWSRRRRACRWLSPGSAHGSRRRTLGSRGARRSCPGRPWTSPRSTSSSTRRRRARSSDGRRIRSRSGSARRWRGTSTPTGFVAPHCPRSQIRNPARRTR